MTPQEFQQWIDVLAKPSIGIVAIFILVFYREAVIHLIKTVIDIIGSWLSRKK